MLNSIINTENVYKNKHIEEVAELITKCTTLNGSSELNILKVYDENGSRILALTDHEFEKFYEVHPGLTKADSSYQNVTLLNCSYLMNEYPYFEQLMSDCRVTQQYLIPQMFKDLYKGDNI